MENKKHAPVIAYTEPADYFPKELRKQHKLGEYADLPHLDQIKAVMFGHAVGDALGVPVEFCSREELNVNPVTDMRGFGSYPVPAGSWSDDTSMSLATLDALADGEVDFFQVMVNFATWLKKGKYTPCGKVFDVGNTCRTVVEDFMSSCYSKEHGFLMPPGPEITCWGQTDESSNGNGSLMRIHPLVLHVYVKNLPFETWRWIIESGSMLTHAHERSILGCLIYAFVLMHLLADPTKSALKNGLARAECHLRDHPELFHYKRIFTDNFADLPRDEIKSSGYVVDTLEEALWCLLTTDSYRDCVLKAVNLGKDTDTVAAVAGGLAGALYGYDAIPAEWLNTLKKRAYIEGMCERAAKAWSREGRR